MQRYYKKQELTFPALRMGAVTAKHALNAWIVPAEQAKLEIQRRKEI